jgi:hypothetical protein
MPNELGELLARYESESSGGYNAYRIHGHSQIFKGKRVTAKRYWLAAALWVLCAPCAFGYSSSSVWAPSPKPGNFSPASEGSLYAPGPPQKHMPSAPLLHKKIPYLDARRIVMAHGWKPRPTEEKSGSPVYKCGNPENGDDYFNKMCKKFPEVAAISGDGFCKMRFYKNHVQLNIFLYECDLDDFTSKFQWVNQVVGWEVVRFTDY